MGEFILGCIAAVIFGWGAGVLLYVFIQNRKDKSK